MATITATVTDGNNVTLNVEPRPAITVTIDRGTAGPAGAGVAPGGTIGQVLAKSSSADYATQWVDQAGGSYTLPTASAIILGGVKVGAGLAIDGAGVMSATGGGGGVSSFNTRTGAVTLTSADVTTALTFTPYSATNPSGYITSSALTPYLPSATAATTYLALTGGTLSGGLNAGGVIQSTVGGFKFPDGTTQTTAATGSGSSGVSSFNTRTGAVTLTGADVTGALTFTPYNATNPSGYTSNTGTVTSVSGTGTVSGLTLSGTVTASGSLTLGGALSVTPSNFASQAANTILAAPNGASGVPTFRAIAAADIPTLNQNTTGTATNVTGVVAVANGGTGTATPALIAGTNVTISGAWPNQTIAAVGGGGSGTVTSITAGTGLTGGTITGSGTIALADTAVTAGIYSSANITVDQQGRITAAANGSGGSTNTNIDGGLPDSNYGGISPIDGGTP